MFIHRAFLRLPPSARSLLKRMLGSSGHATSVLDALKARKDAAGKKRLDNALHEVLAVLGAQRARSVVGRRCIDFGAGYVPMDGLCLWLLGAESVTAVDYNRIASIPALRRGVASADITKVESMLLDIHPRKEWQERLRQLQDVAVSGDFASIGFEYLAPLDVVSSPEQLPEFDLIWSLSVLEHVAPSLLPALLSALASRARSGALHVHRIDLRDHRDFENPYAFLDPTLGFNAETDADVRGNGMTELAWRDLLERNPGYALEVLAVSPGDPRRLPAAIRAGGVERKVADFITVGGVTR